VLAVCAAVACQAADSLVLREQEERADAVPDRSGVPEGSASRAQVRPDARRVSAVRELFESRTWDTPRVTAAAPVEEGRSASPPFGYQYIGRMEVEGRLTVHLAKGEKLYAVRVGDVLDGVFRVEAIKTDGLELTYLPRRSKQFVAFSAIAPPTPQANVATRPEAQPPRTTINLPGVPGGPGVPPAPTGSVAVTPGGGPAEATPGSPNMPSIGGESGAPATAPTAEAAPGAPPMSISPPVSQMPVGPPTVSMMPTLPPVDDAPASAPSGATTATTPPPGGM
jgi:hypothetical protein